MSTRRDFLKTSLNATVATSVISTYPRILHGQRISILTDPDPKAKSSFLDDPNIKEIAKRAVDIARQAGAQFADVRITKTESFAVSPGSGIDGMGIVDQNYDVTIGIRVLVQGIWGFASGTVPNEIEHIAKDAVEQSKAIAKIQPYHVELASIQKVDNQSWIMPIKIDPFTLNHSEIIDFLASLEKYIRRVPEPIPNVHLRAQFERQDKVYASSEDCLWSQRTYSTSGTVGWAIRIGQEIFGGGLDLLSVAGEGWELFRKQPLHDAIDQEMERIRADAKLPWKPVDVGKYTAVLDQMSVSNLVSNTIGAATELDRVMGYEANASGTSYLHDPFEMLGSFAIGTSLLSVTGNRREPGGAATVQWDDESVVPEEVPLVTEGRLTDFATSRESATWLRGIYTKHGKSVRSNGCMYAPRGIDAPLIHTPNLVMKPGPETETLESLIQGVSNGLYFRGMSINMDFQQLNGLGRGMCYEIKNGKRVARILNTGVLFRTPELWKNLIALGGETSLRRYGNPLWKGEPSQRSAHSVTAYPAVFKDITVVDVMRKV